MKPFRELVLDFHAFLRHYFAISYHISGIQLGILVLILILAAFFAIFEKIRLGRAIYFAFITAMTIGYGDITPHTILGRIISILLGYLGLTFFGILIATATEAVRRALK